MKIKNSVQAQILYTLQLSFKQYPGPLVSSAGNWRSPPPYLVTYFKILGPKALDK